jgi:acetylornithine/succinyldiaminopimelate/putrescine aminotransferase
LGGRRGRFAARSGARRRRTARGVLAKDTHDAVLRLAPPLTIARADLDWALERLAATLAELERPVPSR